MNPTIDNRNPAIDGKVLEESGGLVVERVVLEILGAFWRKG
jgi:hypothetical protein